jgi:peptide/nickel transport system permease protein
MSLVGAEGAADPTTAAVGGRRVGRRHPVLGFLVRRTAAGIATLLVASVLIFVATNALPGNVAEVVLGKNAAPEAVKSLDRELGLDRPLVSRYVSWLGGSVHGNLGESGTEVAQGAPDPQVSGLIGTPLRNSLVLAAATVLLLIPLSLLLGTAAAVRSGRAADYAVSYIALVIGALPEFVFGTFLILIFFSELNLLPPVALVPPGTSPLDNPNILVLPVLTLLGVCLAFSARQIRAGVAEALRQEYVAMARLGGIRERRVLWRYALRNAMAPAIQTYAQTIQYLFGGIVIVEALFAYPGIGQLLVQSVSERDVTAVQGIAIVLAAIYILVNILADLAVVFLVPKLRTAL